MGRVDIDLRRGAIQVIVGGYTEEAAIRAAENLIDKAKLNVLRKGRWQTGAMFSGYRLDVERRGLVTKVRVYNVVDYYTYQEMGTHGSHAAPGKVLRFTVGSRVVYARHTAPIPPGNFLKDAVRAMSPSDWYTR